MKEQEVEALLFIGLSGHLQDMFAQVNELEFDGFMIGPSQLADPNVRNELGDSAEGAFALVPKFYNDFVPAQEFKEKYMSEYDFMPGHESASAHDLLLNMIIGIRQNMTTISRRDVIDHMYRLESSINGSFGSFTINSIAGTLSYDLFPVKIEGGNVVYLTEN